MTTTNQEVTNQEVEVKEVNLDNAKTVSLQGARIKKNPKQVVKVKDLMNFDLAIQRNYVWDLERKSLLINTMIQGYPIPFFYAQAGIKKGEIQFLDGKQRLSTIISFVTGEFKLHGDTPAIEIETEDGGVDYVEIAGKSFDELPNLFKDEVLGYDLDIYEFKFLNDEQRDELFRRLNNGMALNKMELTRVIAGSGVMDFIHKLAKSQFFNDNIAIGGNARNRFTDEELILQIIALANNKFEPTSFEGKDMKALAINLKDNGIPEELKTVLLDTTEYLNKAFVAGVKEKFLKKTNVPILFAQAVKAQELKIEPSKFAGWATILLSDDKKRGGTYKPTNSYGGWCQKGVAKIEAVKGRLTEMAKHFDANIKDAPEYKAPEAKGGKKNEVDDLKGLVIETTGGDLVVMDENNGGEGKDSKVVNLPVNADNNQEASNPDELKVATGE